MPRSRLPLSSPLEQQRAGLFAAVKQAPDDDTPRLILADWLEEYGDEEDLAHAELIRVQCEVLRRSAQIIAPHDPGPLHALLCSAGYYPSMLPGYFMPLTDQDERILSLRQREKELIERFGGPRLNSLPVEHRCQWKRGFALLDLAGATLGSQKMADFAASRAGPWVEALAVRLDTGDSARVGQSPLLAHVAGLEVHGDRVGVEDLRTLLASSHLVGLRRLTRRFGMYTPLALENVPQRERLTHLHLHSSILLPSFLHSFARAGWPALQALHLGRSREVGHLGVLALLSGPFFAHLRELDLSDCQLENRTVEALVNSPHFRCPDLLQLDDNMLHGPGALLAARRLERLVVLSVSGNRWNDAAMESLAGCRRLTSLLHLNVSHNTGLGPASAEILASSPHLGRLVSLSMEGCPIGEPGGRALLHSPHLGRLSLRMDPAGISADTLAALRKRYFLSCPRERG